MHLATLASSFLFATSVAAHGGVVAYTIGGKKYTGYGVKSLQAQNRFTTTNPGSSIQRAWSEIRPVNDPNSKAIACNKPGAAAKLSASIAAGESIVAHWNSKSDGNPWPHAGGPITVYMAECKGDCSTWADPSEGEWFKIFQSGLLSGTIGKGKWGTNEMMEKGFKVETRIPASLKPGNYLIRHETINLARAPAEFYPECAQLKVTGSGTESPGKEFRFRLPGAYKTSDSAIKYSMHDAPVASSSKYTIPGPQVWKGGAGGAKPNKPKGPTGGPRGIGAGGTSAGGTSSGETSAGETSSGETTAGGASAGGASAGQDSAGTDAASTAQE